MKLVGLQLRDVWEVDGAGHDVIVEEVISIEVDTEKQFKKMHKLLLADWRIAHGINCLILQEDGKREEWYQYMRLDYPKHRRHEWVQVYGNAWIQNPEAIIYPYQSYCFLNQRVFHIKQWYAYTFSKLYGVDEEEALAWYATNRDTLLAVAS